MRIGEREIGPEHPPYIIAELGVNHDGSVARALELVDAAAKSGADAVKLQLFRADLLMSKAAKLAAYQKAAGEDDPVEMLRRLELSVEQMRPVVERAHGTGLHAIVTVFSVELVEEAERLAWDAYKSASPDIINRPLLEAMAGTSKPLIVSTGASTIDEVQQAIGWLGSVRSRLAILQCVSCYPTRDEDRALGGIGALSDMFDGPVGYSDHTIGGWAGSDAMVLGASILEKHITYDRSARGPDHAASADMDEFRGYPRAMYNRWALFAGAVETLRARLRSRPHWAEPREKRVLPCEQEVRSASRQSVTTRRAIARGEVLTRHDLTIKRPAMGIQPWRIDEVVGRVAATDIDADMPIMESDVAPP